MFCGLKVVELRAVAKKIADRGDAVRTGCRKKRVILEGEESHACGALEERLEARKTVW